MKQQQQSLEKEKEKNQLLAYSYTEKKWCLAAAGKKIEKKYRLNEDHM